MTFKNQSKAQIKTKTKWKHKVFDWKQRRVSMRNDKREIGDLFHFHNQWDSQSINRFLWKREFGWLLCHCVWRNKKQKREKQVWKTIWLCESEWVSEWIETHTHTQTNTQTHTNDCSHNDENCVSFLVSLVSHHLCHHHSSHGKYQTFVR